MGDHEETDPIRRQSGPLQHMAGSTEGLDICWRGGGFMENRKIPLKLLLKRFYNVIFNLLLSHVLCGQWTDRVV